MATMKPPDQQELLIFFSRADFFFFFWKIGRGKHDAVRGDSRLFHSISMCCSIAIFVLFSTSLASQTPLRVVP